MFSFYVKTLIRISEKLALHENCPQQKTVKRTNVSNLSLLVRLRFSGGGGETHSSGQEGLALALQVKIFSPDPQHCLKGTVPRDFCFRFLSMNRLPPSP
jgi:hypothetical protein